MGLTVALNEIKEKYGFNEVQTGGNCTAWCTDLNVNQDTIYVTDSDGICSPTEDTEFFYVGVYLDKDEGQGLCMFETDNIDHLDTLIQACFTLWGNKYDTFLL